MKISTILKSTICVILFAFSIFCVFLNFYITIPIGIISLFLSLIISPLFDILSKKLDKKFTKLQKITIFYGIVMLSFYSTTFCEINNFLDNGNKLVYYVINFVVILLYLGLFFLFNKNKYNKEFKINIKKRIILIVLVIVLMNLPLVVFKGYSLYNYYSNVYETIDYGVLDDIYIKSYETKHNLESFGKLNYKMDLDGYNLSKTSEHMKEYTKDDYSYIRVSQDLINPVYRGITIKDSISLNYYKYYDITSVGRFYDHFYKYKNFSMFDSLYNIICTEFNSVVALRSIETIQKINLDNDLIVYLLTLNSERQFYELIVDNKEYAYSITFIDSEGYIDRDYILEYVKYLSIS